MLTAVELCIFFNHININTDDIFKSTKAISMTGILVSVLSSFYSGAIAEIHNFSSSKYVVANYQINYVYVEHVFCTMSLYHEKLNSMQQQQKLHRYGIHNKY